MAVITTRAGKGAPLTNAELDANFNNINDGITTNAAITGGSINGTTIGGTTPSTGSFSQLDVDNIRVDGDTISNTAANTSIVIMPNGTGVLSISSVTAVTLPAGTTAQRPTPVAGMLRFNGDEDEFEGYNGTEWGAIGGGAEITNDTTTSTDIFPLLADATSGKAADVFTSDSKLLYKPSTGEFKSDAVVAQNALFVNSATVTSSYTVPTGSNAHSVGPVVVDSAVVVTVPSGSRWLIS
jgi:hypothetical protein